MDNERSSLRKLLIITIVLTVISLAKLVSYRSAGSAWSTFDWDNATKSGAVKPSGEIALLYTLCFGPNSAVDEAMLRAKPLAPACESERDLLLQSFKPENGEVPPTCSGVDYNWRFKPGSRQVSLIYFSKLQMPKATGRMVSARKAADSICKAFPAYCLSSSTFDPDESHYDNSD